MEIQEVYSNKSEKLHISKPEGGGLYKHTPCISRIVLTRTALVLYCDIPVKAKILKCRRVA